MQPTRKKTPRRNRARAASKRVRQKPGAMPGFTTGEREGYARGQRGKPRSRQAEAVVLEALERARDQRIRDAASLMGEVYRPDPLPKLRDTLHGLPTRPLEPYADDGVLCYCSTRSPRDGDCLWVLCRVLRCHKITADVQFLDDGSRGRRVRLGSLREVRVR